MIIASLGQAEAQVPQAMHSSVILYAILITSLQIFNLLYHMKLKMQWSVLGRICKPSKKGEGGLPLGRTFFSTGDR